MKIDLLKQSVAKSEEKVAKCAKTIERHEKLLNKKIQALIKQGVVDLTGLSRNEIETIQDGYRGTDISSDIFDIKYKKEDIKGATRKLQDAEQILENWKGKLSKEVENERFIEGNAPQIIKDFLEDWKSMSYEWHVKRYDSYQRFKKKLNEARDVEIIGFVESNTEEFERYLENGKLKDYWKKDLMNIRGKGLRMHLELSELDYDSIQKRRNNFAGGAVLKMDEIYKAEERLAWLEKTIEAEKKRKMIDLINRIHDVVGKIIDAKGLKVSPQGDLDGVIIGEEGSVKINTVGAGGWNIQCWHYRVLLKKL